MATLLNFHHIKKTAGTTVAAVLKQFFAYGQSVNSLDLARDFKKSCGADFDSNTTEMKHEAVRKWVEGKFSSEYRFAYGHGNLININELKIPTFSFFRQPQSQIYSMFMQLSQNNEHDIDEKKVSDEVIDLLRLSRNISFEEFIRIDHPFIKSQFWNPQLFSFYENRFFVDLFDKENYYNSINSFKIESSNILGLAKKKMENMFFVGLTDSANEDLNTILSILGLPDQRIVQKHNVRSRQIDLEKMSKRIPEEYFEFDLQLYEHAKSIRSELQPKNRHYVYFSDSDFAVRTLETKENSDTYFISEPLIGTGWQERFLDREHVCAWTGPGTETTLKLRVSEAKSYTITIGVVGAQDGRQIEKAKILINNRECATKLRSSDSYPHFLLETNAWLPEEAELGIKIPFCKSPSEAPNVTDYRTLGIVVAYVKLTPGGTGRRSSFRHFFKRWIRKIYQ